MYSIDPVILESIEDLHFSQKMKKREGKNIITGHSLYFLGERFMHDEEKLQIGLLSNKSLNISIIIVI